MTTAFDVKVTQDFSTLITLDQCKDLIRDLVAVLAVEHGVLREAVDKPVAIDEATAKLFSLGPNHGLDTVNMAKARVAYFELAQDRLWDWYRKLSSG